MLTARASAPPKPVPVKGNVAHFYFTPSGRLAVEIDRGDYSVAMLAPTYTKTDILRRAPAPETASVKEVRRFLIRS